MVVFLFIISKLDYNIIYSIVNDINLIYLTIAILLNFPQLFLKSIRWNLLLAKQNINYSLYSSFMIFLNSLYIGMITPGRIGEFIRVLHLKNDKSVNIGKGFSIVLIDRLFDLYLLMIIGSVGMWRIGIFGDFSNIFIFFIFLIFISPLLLLNSIFINSFVSILYKATTIKKNKYKIEASYATFFKNIKELVGFNLLVSAFLTFSSYFIFFLQCYLIVLSMDLKISFLTITSFMAISNLISFIPISISGLGTRDATLIYLFSLESVGSETAVIYSLLVFITFFVIGALIGLGAWFIKPIKADLNF